MAELKFKLTAETKTNIFGYQLFRIEALVDFITGGGVKVSAGEKGGWLETDTLKDGNARVSGNAWVSDDAQVYGNARVSGNAQVSDDAQVYGNAWVSDDAQVYGNAWVYGNAVLKQKKRFTKGWFVAGDDDSEPKKCTVLGREVSDGYWENTYVLGDYAIEDIEEEKKSDGVDQATSEPQQAAVMVQVGDVAVSVPASVANDLLGALQNAVSSNS